MPAIQDTLHIHTLDPTRCLEVLDTSVQQGLSEAQVLQRTSTYGPNILPTQKPASVLKIFLNQLKSVLVFILLLSAIISFFYHHYIDAGIILFIITINTIVGFFQEYQAQRSIESLKKIIVQKVTALRGGNKLSLSTDKLVPGDIIMLGEGDVVPADCRLLSANNLQTNESSLTGESLSIPKNPASILLHTTSLADRTNMLWMGSAVVSGFGQAVVCTTGAKTQLGTIAASLNAIEDQEDHFRIKTNELARQMALLAVITVVFMFLVGLTSQKYAFEQVLMFSVSSLVSAIPEGLPVILTIVLALSAKRMAKRNALVRRLSATETLAVVDTIVTDKTGTLTQNKMTVTAIATADISALELQPETLGDSKLSHNKTIEKMVHIAGICNAVVVPDTKLSDQNPSGDATEVALWQFWNHASERQQAMRTTLQKIEDVPFNQTIRSRFSVVAKDDVNRQLFTVGAPESVLAWSTNILTADGSEINLTDTHTKHIHSQIDHFTSKGMRVLAIAYKNFPQNKAFQSTDAAAFTFCGIVGLTDPPRSDASEAIMKAHKAGITVIMATGDHPATALAIGQSLGIVQKQIHDHQVLTGVQFDALSDQEALAILPKVRIFARMTPMAKTRLARLLQSRGKVVAMTGDGVNDAPALKQADIGISMGKNGTDVAREASDIILLDDNFSTIVAAIEEGRTQLRNIRRTSFFYITTNLAQTLTLILFMFLGFPLPLLPKQILWLNLVTAGITDIALAMEPAHDDVMSTPPKPKKEPILNTQVIPYLGIISTSIMLLTYFFFVQFQDADIQKARAAVFSILAISQLFCVLNMRSLRGSVFSIGIFSSHSVNLALLFSFILLLAVLYIPALAQLFEFHPLHVGEFLFIFVAASIVFWLSESYKFVFMRTSPSRALA